MAESLDCHEDELILKLAFLYRGWKEAADRYPDYRPILQIKGGTCVVVDRDPITGDVTGREAPTRNAFFIGDTDLTSRELDQADAEFKTLARNTIRILEELGEVFDRDEKIAPIRLLLWSRVRDQMEPFEGEGTHGNGFLYQVTDCGFRIVALAIALRFPQIDSVAPVAIEESVAGENEVVLGKSAITGDYFFVKNGANYKVRFDRDEGDIPAKLLGAQYAHRLLGAPNRAISAQELWARAASDGDKSGLRSVAKTEIDGPDEQHDGRIFVPDREPEIRAQIAVYRESANDLGRELDEAKESKDEPREERIQRDLTMVAAEIGRLERELNQIRRGRTLPEVGDPAENARKAVGNALSRLYKNCLRKYGLPELAKHLESTLRGEGNDFIYRPAEPPPSWRLF